MAVHLVLPAIHTTSLDSSVTKNESEKTMGKKAGKGMIMALPKLYYV